MFLKNHGILAREITAYSKKKVKKKILNKSQTFSSEEVQTTKVNLGFHLYTTYLTSHVMSRCRPGHSCQRKPERVNKQARKYF